MFPSKFVKAKAPLKATAKRLWLTAFFAKPTGISGYTLVSNSRGLRFLEHRKIADVRTAYGDIESVSETLELQKHQTTISDTDLGQKIREKIEDLNNLLAAYRNGLLKAQ